MRTSLTEVSRPSSRSLAPPKDHVVTGRTSQAGLGFTMTPVSWGEPVASTQSLMSLFLLIYFA